MGILVKKLIDGKKQGSKMALHEAVSNQRHPAIHTFQTVFFFFSNCFFGGGVAGEAFSTSSKEIRGRKFLDYYKRNFTVAL